MMKFTIDPITPHNFELMMNMYKDIKGESVDIVYNGIYRRVLRIDNKNVLVLVQSVGTVTKPKLSVCVYPESVTGKHVEEKIRHMFSTDVDLSVFYSIIKNDRVLSKLKDKLYGLKARRTPSIFEALIIAILEQQVALSFAVTLQGRLARKYGEHLTFKRKKYYAFPTPETLSEANAQDLRNLQLSGRKAEYIIDISKGIVNGEINLESLKNLSNDEVINTLTEIRGIGKWSAEYILVRGFGRLDALPADDAGLKRAISKYYYNGKQVSTEDIRGMLNKYGEYKSYAAYYLLCADRLNNTNSNKFLKI